MDGWMGCIKFTLEWWETPGKKAAGSDPAGFAAAIGELAIPDVPHMFHVQSKRRKFSEKKTHFIGGFL